MTKSGAATAATGLQQKAVLLGLRSRFAADRQRAGGMPALQENDVTVFAKNRCSRSACSHQRLVSKKKKRGAGRLPVFSFSVCRRSCRRHRRRRAPQKRCVNGCQNSRPGGVILPPLPCTSNYNFAFTPLPGSAQAKSLRAPSAKLQITSVLYFPPCGVFPCPLLPDRSPPPEACCVACDCGASCCAGA
jgi:hypothetical protein